MIVFSDTDLTAILGCDPLANGKKDCIDISVSYPLSIGFHALGGYRNLNPGGFNAMDFVQDRVLSPIDHSRHFDPGNRPRSQLETGNPW